MPFNSRKAFRRRHVYTNSVKWSCGHISISPEPSCGQRERSDSLRSSWDSIMSEGSMDSPNFNRRNAFSYTERERSDSAISSSNSINSEGSMDPLWNFKNRSALFRLDHCGISDERSAALNSSLRSNPSHPHPCRHSCG
ncbi:hypothetical protein Q7C36_003972 [Tachysurus vachellii]|uniref:Uncharacterized protein n=1 Tax=Tachysurus vachellii TaxID=175792 RepID=A0AA88NTZ8_TACVA|nr:hypothetical protein Q7C36_003972 [Tachysurus vachellii]